MIRLTALTFGAGLLVPFYPAFIIATLILTLKHFETNNVHISKFLLTNLKFIGAIARSKAMKQSQKERLLRYARNDSLIQFFGVPAIAKNQLIPETQTDLLQRIIHDASARRVLENFRVQLNLDRLNAIGLLKGPTKSSTDNPSALSPEDFVNFIKSSSLSLLSETDKGAQVTWLITDFDPSNLKRTIQAHYKKTGSNKIKRLLDQWDMNVVPVTTQELRAKGLMNKEGVLQVREFVLTNFGLQGLNLPLQITTTDPGKWDISGLREQLIQFILWATKGVSFIATPSEIQRYIEQEKIFARQA